MKNVKKSNIISLEQARHLAVLHKGLMGQSTNKTHKIGAITNIGYVQIDTLAVIARAHHPTLWSRLPNYKEQELDDLMTKKRIFEYWSLAASYLPMSDYRFSLPPKRIFLWEIILD